MGLETSQNQLVSTGLAGNWDLEQPLTICTRVHTQNTCSHPHTSRLPCSTYYMKAGQLEALAGCLPHLPIFQPEVEDTVSFLVTPSYFCRLPDLHTVRDPHLGPLQKTGDGTQQCQTPQTIPRILPWHSCPGTWMQILEGHERCRGQSGSLDCIGEVIQDSVLLF